MRRTRARYRRMATKPHAIRSSSSEFRGMGLASCHARFTAAIPSASGRAIGLVERGADASRQLLGAAVAPEVHVEQARLVGQAMLVHRLHVDAIGFQRL